MLHYPDCLAPDDCWCEAKRYARVLRVAAGVLLIQGIGALASGSLALWADTVHVVLDNAAIVVTLSAAVLVKLGAHGTRTRMVGFWVNVGLLFFLVGWILVEAYERLDAPRPVVSEIMMLAAAVGFAGNLWQHRILEEVDRDHQHAMHRSLAAHVLSDLWVSLGVLLAGGLIWVFKTPIIDPVTSVAVALWIVCMIARLIRDERPEKIRPPHTH